MALVYLDASALVKLCVDEPGSALAAALWDGADVIATCRIADAEVRATLAGGRRSGRLDPVAARRAVADRAAQLIARYPLRGGDALHLAAAMMLASPDLVVAVWDEHVAAAARAERLRVVP
jgi:predicted nucleic acid-binding protein